VVGTILQWGSHKKRKLQPGPQILHIAPYKQSQKHEVQELLRWRIAYRYSHRLLHRDETTWVNMDVDFRSKSVVDPPRTEEEEVWATVAKHDDAIPMFWIAVARWSHRLEIVAKHEELWPARGRFLVHPTPPVRMDHSLPCHRGMPREEQETKSMSNSTLKGAKPSK
jgi:hypothetical protein